MDKVAEEIIKNEFICDVCREEVEDIYTFSDLGWGYVYKLPQLKGRYCKQCIDEIERKIKID